MVRLYLDLLLFIILHLYCYLYLYPNALAENLAETMKREIVTFYTKKVKEHSYVFASCYCDDARVLKNVGNKGPAVKTAIKKHYALCQLGELPFLSSDVEAIISKIISPDKIRKGKQLITLLWQFHDAIQSGEILNKGKRYSDAAVKACYYYIHFLEQHTDLGEIDVERFNSQHLAKFQSKLVERGKSQNTVSAYSNGLLGFFRRTYRKWHDNPLHKEEDVRVNPENIDHAVYYSAEELARLYEYPFTGLDEHARDIFVYGCNIGLRESDYRAHGALNIIDGFIVTNTQKRDKTVHIPLNPMVKAILAKYNGAPPKMPKQSFRHAIQRVCKAAGFDDQVLWKRTIGGKKVDGFKPKWAMTSAHTMRRSMATNMALSGIDVYTIMDIMGWTRIETAMKYFKASGLEKAKRAAQLPFFTGKAG